ncbi:MAG: diguanylate cyclase [Phycisphaerae bacterium]|nr:diguanylate cyclase [Gemmatimonadaceae bacterium]
MTDLPTTERTALILSSGRGVPPWFAEWTRQVGLRPTTVQNADDLLAVVLRSRPRLILIDARGNADAADVAMACCLRLKRDSFSAIVPLAVMAHADLISTAFAAGADEVLVEANDAGESAVRMSAMLRRSDRDTDVHPSTRLPGTREIGRELERRIASREKFAVCYADLDYFKEFNDRYSYFRGNQVIQLLARLLHDVVKGLCGEEGFVGHIGGDDFLYMVPIAATPRVCDEVVRVFDELMPMQYSDQDRRVGYFFGKDRQGQLHKVPLMTLSIGVVTNQRRRFLRASEVSELATEMKSYAKTLPGSLWVVDRRRDEVAGGAALAARDTQSGAASAPPRDTPPRVLNSGGAR